MKNSNLKFVLLGLVLFSSFSFISYRWNTKLTKKVVETTNIKVPAGFVVQILASDLGATRHMTISKNGDIYAKLSKLKEFAPKTEDKEGYIGVKSIGNREGQLEFADLLDSNVEQTKNRINILKKQLDEEKKAREKELLASLQEKYGVGNINIETGEITPF